MQGSAVSGRISWGLAAAALIMLAVAIAMSLAAEESAERNDRVQHTHEVLELIERSYAAIKDAESAQRGFLLTGRPDLELAFFAAGPESGEFARQLIEKLAERPDQRDRAQRMAALIEQRLLVAAEVLQLYRAEGLEAARDSVDAGRGLELMRGIEQLRDELAASERRLLTERNERADNAAWRFLLGVELGQALSLLILFIVAWRMVVEMRQREWAEAETLASNKQLTEAVNDLRRRSAQTRAMTEFAGMLQGCKAVEEALGVCHDAMLRLSPGTGGSLYLMRHSQNLLELAAMWGDPEPASSSVLPPDDCWAMRRGQRYLVQDLRSATTCKHVESHDDEHQGSSYLCLPLIAQGQIMGMLHLRGLAEVVEDDSEIASAAAEQLSLALSNLQLQESLRVQSIRDPLTGLFNRRYLEESFERELARCERRNLPLCVMMFDVDHFKHFNDTHGHDGGDALLAALGKLIPTQCRTEDIACRFGGEEFTIILPELALDQAAGRADALRKAVEDLQVTHLKERLSAVTASIGVAAFPNHGRTTQDLTRAADGALYRAKRGGRNRVELA